MASKGKKPAGLLLNTEYTPNANAPESKGANKPVTWKSVRDFTDFLMQASVGEVMQHAASIGDFFKRAPASFAKVINELICAASVKGIDKHREVAIKLIELYGESHPLLDILSYLEVMIVKEEKPFYCRQILQYLLKEHGAKLNLTYSWKSVLLENIAKTGDVDLFHALFDLGEVTITEKVLFTTLGDGHHALVKAFIAKQPSCATIGQAKLGKKEGNVLVDTGPMIYGAAMFGDKDLLDKFIEAKADIHFVSDIMRNRLLHATAMRGNQQLNRHLVETYGLDPNALNADGQTPVFFAAREQNFSVISAFLEQKADLSIRDRLGNTPLHCLIEASQASQFNRAELENEFHDIEQLLQEESAREVKASPAAAAASADDAPAPAAAVRADAASSMSLIPMSQGNESKSIEDFNHCLEALIKGGVDPNAVSQDGDTALQVMATKPHLDITVLLRYNPNVNAQNKKGQTALILAINASNWVAVYQLIRHPEVRLDLADHKGMTALHYLAKLAGSERDYRHPEVDSIIEELIAAGADASLRDGAFVGSGSGSGAILKLMETRRKQQLVLEEKIGAIKDIAELRAGIEAATQKIVEEKALLERLKVEMKLPEAPASEAKVSAAVAAVAAVAKNENDSIEQKLDKAAEEDDVLGVERYLAAGADCTLRLGHTADAFCQNHHAQVLITKALKQSVLPTEAKQADAAAPEVAAAAAAAPAETKAGALEDVGASTEKPRITLDDFLNEANQLSEKFSAIFDNMPSHSLTGYEADAALARLVDDRVLHHHADKTTEAQTRLQLQKQLKQLHHQCIALHVEIARYAHVVADEILQDKKPPEALSAILCGSHIIMGEAEDKSGMSIVTKAIRQGHRPLITYLAEQGASVTYQHLVKLYDNKPLPSADFILFLLPLTTDDNTRDKDELFLLAYLHNDCSVMDWLTQHRNVSLRHVKGKMGATALHHWASLAKEKTIATHHALNEELLTHLNTRDSIGATPLMVAYAVNNMATASHLLEQKRIDVNRQDNSGQTALHLLVLWQPMTDEHERHLRRLLALKADIDIVNHQGETALIKAAKARNQRAMALLVAYGARTDIQDKDGRIAADYDDAIFDLFPTTSPWEEKDFRKAVKFAQSRAYLVRHQERMRHFFMSISPDQAQSLLEQVLSESIHARKADVVQYLTGFVTRPEALVDMLTSLVTCLASMQHHPAEDLASYRAMAKHILSLDILQLQQHQANGLLKLLTSCGEAELARQLQEKSKIPLTYRTFLMAIAYKQRWLVEQCLKEHPEYALSHHRETNDAWSVSVPIANHPAADAITINTFEPPLYIAGLTGDRGMIELLIKAGARPGDCYSPTGGTLLHATAYQGDEQLQIDLIREYKLDPNACRPNPGVVNANDLQQYPLEIAARSQNPGAIRAFISNGVDVRRQGLGGKTALHHLVAPQLVSGDLKYPNPSPQFFESFYALADAGVDINQREFDFTSTTVLRCMIENPAIDIAPILSRYQDRWDVNTHNASANKLEQVTPLVYAIKRNNWRAVKALAFHPTTQLDLADKCGFTALHHAAKHPDGKQAVEWLIAAGADCSLFADKSGKPGESKMANDLTGNIHDDEDIRKRRAEQKAIDDVVNAFSDEQLSFHTAAEQKQLEQEAKEIHGLQQELVRIQGKIARLNLPSSDQKREFSAGFISTGKGYPDDAYSTFHQAGYGSVDQLKGVLQYASYQAQNIVLRYAVRAGNYANAKVILENQFAKETINASCHYMEFETLMIPNDSGPVIYMAACRGDLKMVKLLVSHGADPRAKSTEKGNGLVHVAVLNNDVALLNYLTNREAKSADADLGLALPAKKELKLNLDEKNNEGMTPAMLAVAKRHLASLNVLLAVRPDLINTRDKNGDTLVHQLLKQEIAVSDEISQRARLVSLHALIEAKADMHTPNAQGITPLMLAAQISKEPSLLEAILAVPGRNVNAADTSGMTALHYAAQSNHSAGISALLDAGADCALRLGQTADDFAKNAEVQAMIRAARGSQSVSVAAASAGLKEAKAEAIPGQQKLQQRKALRHICYQRLANQEGLPKLKKRLAIAQFEQFCAEHVDPILKGEAKFDPSASPWVDLSPGLLQQEDRRRESLLVKMVQCNRLDIIDYLLAKGAVATEEWMSFCYDGRKRTTEATVLHLLEKCPGILSDVEDAKRIFCRAFGEGHEQVLAWLTDPQRKLIDGPAITNAWENVNRCDSNGRTRLMQLINDRAWVAVWAFIQDPRVSLDIVDKDGLSALHYAAQLPKGLGKPVIRWLIAAGADCSVRGGVGRDGDNRTADEVVGIKAPAQALLEPHRKIQLMHAQQSNGLGELKNLEGRAVEIKAIRDEKEASVLKHRENLWLVQRQIAKLQGKSDESTKTEWMSPEQSVTFQGICERVRAGNVDAETHGDLGERDLHLLARMNLPEAIQMHLDKGADACLRTGRTAEEFATDPEIQSMIVAGRLEQQQALMETKAVAGDGGEAKAAVAVAVPTLEARFLQRQQLKRLSNQVIAHEIRLEKIPEELRALQEELSRESQALYMIALGRNDRDTIRWLVTGKIIESRALFMLAARANDVDTMRWLAKEKFVSPELAVKAGDTRWLKENGLLPANAGAVADPLLAIKMGNIQWLVEQKLIGNLAEARGPEGRTALHYWVEIIDGNVARTSLEYLRQQGVLDTLLNMPNEHRSVPLIEAVSSGNKVTMTLLLEAKADVRLSDNAGNTALHHMVVLSDFDEHDLTLLLMQEGCSALINAVNNRGETPLIRAAKANNQKAVRFLLDNGVERDIADKSGKTALMYANMMGFAQLFKAPVVSAAAGPASAAYQARAQQFVEVPHANVSRGVIPDVEMPVAPAPAAAAAAPAAAVAVALPRAPAPETKSAAAAAAGAGYDNLGRLAAAHSFRNEDKRGNGQLTLAAFLETYYAQYTPEQTAYPLFVQVCGEMKAKEHRELANILFLQAFIYGHTQITAWLKKHASVDPMTAKDLEGKTVLHYIAERSDASSILFYLAQLNGCDLKPLCKVRDKSGATPLILAAKRKPGDVQLVSAIRDIDHGATQGLRDYAERTAADHYAAQNGATAILGAGAAAARL